MADSQLLVVQDQNTPPCVHIHPVVVISILDHYVRRIDTQERVIGTLLGVRLPDGVIEIRDCFPVPHDESQDVAVDMHFHLNMYNLHRRATPKEVIVGWYATGNNVDENSALIQSGFYNDEVAGSPIHLTVDTAVTGGNMAIKAYFPESVTLSEERPLGTLFHPLPHRILTRDTERAGIDLLLRHKQDEENLDARALVNDLDGLEASLKSLDTMLGNLKDYVGKVLSGEEESDARIGRFLSETMATIPRIDSNSFEKLINNSMQDLLMVVYLANLTKTQLKFAEKLQSHIA